MKSAIKPLNGFPRTKSSFDSLAGKLDDELCKLDFRTKYLPSLIDREELLDVIRLTTCFDEYPSTECMISIMQSKVAERFHIIDLIWRWNCRRQLQTSAPTAFLEQRGSYPSPSVHNSLECCDQERTSRFIIDIGILALK